MSASHFHTMELGTSTTGRLHHPSCRARASVAMPVYVLPTPTSKARSPPRFASTRRAPATWWGCRRGPSFFQRAMARGSAV